MNMFESTTLLATMQERVFDVTIGRESVMISGARRSRAEDHTRKPWNRHVA